MKSPRVDAARRRLRIMIAATRQAIPITPSATPTPRPIFAPLLRPLEDRLAMFVDEIEEDAAVEMALDVELPGVDVEAAKIYPFICTPCTPPIVPEVTLRGIQSVCGLMSAVIVSPAEKNEIH